NTHPRAVGPAEAAGLYWRARDEAAVQTSTSAIECVAVAPGRDVCHLTRGVRAGFASPGALTPRAWVQWWLGRRSAGGRSAASCATLPRPCQRRDRWSPEAR